MMKRHILVTMMLAVGMASTQSHSGELGIGAAFASLGAPQKGLKQTITLYRIFSTEPTIGISILCRLAIKFIRVNSCR